jgi:hypothetical protein
MGAGSEVDEAVVDNILGQAAEMGISAKDVIACFTEHLRFAYWRYDGSEKNVFVSANFGQQQSDRQEFVNGLPLYVSDMHQDDRPMVAERIRSAYEEKRGAIFRYRAVDADGDEKIFVASFKYRSYEDGRDELFGISYECFKSARLITLHEPANKSK